MVLFIKSVLMSRGVVSLVLLGTALLNLASASAVEQLID